MRNWKRYLECVTCGASAGKPCVSLTSQRGQSNGHDPLTVKHPHKGRYTRTLSPGAR